MDVALCLVALCLAGAVHCGEMPGTARGMLVAGALGRVTPRGLLPSVSPGARAVHPPWAGPRSCGPGAAATGGGVSVPVGGPGRRRSVGEGGARVAGGGGHSPVGGWAGAAARRGRRRGNPKRGGGEPARGRRGTQADETRRAPLASWLGCGRKEHGAWSYICRHLPVWKVGAGGRYISQDGPGQGQVPGRGKSRALAFSHPSGQSIGGPGGIDQLLPKARDILNFQNGQVQQFPRKWAKWASNYYVKSSCTDHPHTKKFPTSTFWHRLLLHAFLSPKWGR